MQLSAMGVVKFAHFHSSLMTLVFAFDVISKIQQTWITWPKGRSGLYLPDLTSALRNI
jgi:hypothetical protein